MERSQFHLSRKILCGMAAFKQHATFGLWQGAMLSGTDGRKLDGAMGQFCRLTKVSDLPGKRELTAYLRQAMRLIEEGVRDPSTRSSKPQPPVELPEELGVALKANAKARATFEAFPPSCKRDYIEWISEAKRAETRNRRLAQTIEWLAEGKRRNWKYENR